MSRLILVLGDQLSEGVAALRAGDRSTDWVVMAEVRGEAHYVRHHPKKIAFTFSAMRKFAQRLREAHWQVHYTKYDDPANSGSISGELMRRASETGAGEVLATRPGEWRLIQALADVPLKVTQFEDDRFVATHAEFDAWAKDRKELRMEWFYRDMRRKTGLLMEGAAPAGGKWNFDHDNRKAPPKGVSFPGPLRFDGDPEVLDLVRREFPGNFGALDPFWLATDRDEAQAQLAHWIEVGLPGFGDFQDAMLTGERFLYHSVISTYLNAGLLGPLAVCEAVEAAWKAGRVAINAAEGFIRQVIGWREFVRGVYFLEGPDYTSRNALGHQRALHDLYWGAETRMQCLSEAVAQTRDEAYAHHIQRLMITGNFALLAGFDPHEVHEWYLAVYSDAYEWVEAPNTIGMSQFADGGVVGSKPYVSSGAYIDRMSNYCKTCHYRVKEKTGETACPFNLLYWHFLDRHRSRFETNPRMANMYRTWDRIDADRRQTVLSDADRFLEKLEAGDTV